MLPRLHFFEGAGSGEAVLFQHGLCGAAAQTLEVFPNDPRFRLRTLECRGHGASDIGPYIELSIKTFSADIAARIDGPKIVGGISMGAAISLHLAVHRPELVKALVLARPAWVIDAGPSNMRANAEVGDLLARHSPAEAKERFLAGETAKHLRAEAPDNLASLTSFFAREPVADTAALLTAISRDGPGVAAFQVSALKIPTLIIATAQDIIHPMAHARELHALIPSSRLVQITPKGVDKARHIHEFQSTLLKFFEEHA
jgi:pimeloyl-ACP methyl ester carboxylesterase